VFPTFPASAGVFCVHKTMNKRSSDEKKTQTVSAKVTPTLEYVLMRRADKCGLAFGTYIENVLYEHIYGVGHTVTRRNDSDKV
jgi:hypothetical protein